MRITALRQMAGDYGMLMPGNSADVSDHLGKQLIDAGLAVGPTETKVSGPLVIPVAQPAEQPALKIKNKGA